MARKPTMTIRDYVFFLHKQFPSLDLDTCSYYIETYERARFSPDEFTLEEFSTFSTKFQVLLQFFVEKQNK